MRSASLVALALMTMIPVTLPVTVLRGFVHDRFGVSELATSLFMSINMIGAILGAPLAGALSDRLGKRKKLIVAGLAADGALLALLAAPSSFALFMAIRFLEGIAHIVALSLLMALAADGALPGRRGRTMGLVGGGMMMGIALGAPLGGFLGRSGPLVPVLAAGIVGLAAALLAAWVLVEAPPAGKRPGWRQIAGAIVSRPALAVPLAFAFIDRFTVGFYTTTFTLYLRRIHDMESAPIGLAMAALLVPFALLSYPLGRLSERASRSGLMCAGSLAYGIGTISLTWWPPDRLWVLMLGLGVASAVMFVPSLVMTVDLGGGLARATTMGAFNAAGSLGFILGPLTGGLVSQSVAASSGWLAGYRRAFLVAGLAEIVCVIVALPFLLRLVRGGKTT